MKPKINGCCNAGFFIGVIFFPKKGGVSVILPKITLGGGGAGGTPPRGPPQRRGSGAQPPIFF